MDASTPMDVAEVARHLMAAKMFSLASCVMLFYDIFITFGDEVEKIWNQPFTGATVLWFINRYLSPLGFIVVIISFHDPRWTGEVCDRYILYPEILKLFTASAIGLIFILRLYSIYGGSKFVLGSISALLVAQICVKVWAFTDGTSVKLPEGLVGCILTGKDISNRFVYTWVAELVFDTAVFIATLTRTLTIYRRNRTGAAVPLIKVMMRDGVVYFVVIFVANLVTVILFLLLPSDLKAVNSSFSTLITSLMVSRLILNLRSAALRPRYVVTCINSSHSACLADLTPSLTKGEDTQHEGITAPVTSLGKGVVSSGSIRVIEDTDIGTGTYRGGKGIFSPAVIGNLGEPVVGWGSGDYDAETIHDREQPRKQSLHGRDGREMDEEADMQEVPLEIDSDGIMLRERAPAGSERRRPGHHVHRITSHNRECSRSRTHQRDRTRGGASISTTSTSPIATSRLRGIIVEVTRDVRVEPALGSARSDATGFALGRSNTRGTIEQLPEDESPVPGGPSLSTSPLSNAPSLRSLRDLEFAIEEEERERSQTPSRSRGRAKARSGLASLGMGIPSGSSGGRAGRAAGDPAWMPPDTWMLEEGVQMEELGRAK